MSPSRRDRARTGKTGGAQSGHGDRQATAATEPDIPTPGTDDGQRDQPPAGDSLSSIPPDRSATDGAVSDGAVSNGAETAPPRPVARDSTGRQGLAMIGPTSEATRRLVAESRKRQGLSPHINDPAVIESLALFLRNALDTMDRDGRHDGQ
ncbi:hypothetical protein IU469_17890 [Nocardia puris]|uniref:hypothetical protein n=1 Tax=Nocardia puris TaxID=208602 RepID=UPI00189412AE|nr:hypothetical protein [Nocardia puris]MBF6367581.1 hypothetical protein [Nocardia puris]